MSVVVRLSADDDLLLDELFDPLPDELFDPLLDELLLDELLLGLLLDDEERLEPPEREELLVEPDELLRDFVLDSATLGHLRSWGSDAYGSSSAALALDTARRSKRSRSMCSRSSAPTAPSSKSSSS
jgi:hypothetical protein